MSENKKEKEMKPIWFWVGLVLCVYGLIISGMGIYYIFKPEILTKLHQLNPSLWWGSVIFVVGAFFLAISTIAEKNRDTMQNKE